jgi:hypothetical protein
LGDQPAVQLKLRWERKGGMMLESMKGSRKQYKREGNKDGKGRNKLFPSSLTGHSSRNIRGRKF